MSPKEKARQLVNQMLFCFQGHIDKYTAKQCALIAVDEIFIFMKEDDEKSNTCYWANHEILFFYVDVKSEIEKL